MLDSDSGYICLDCGERFAHPMKHSYNHLPGEIGFTETWMGCPYCGGSYDEAVICEGCGEATPRSDAHYDPHTCTYLCDDCYDDLDEEDKEDYD